jgi:hypothetical protein
MDVHWVLLKIAVYLLLPSLCKVKGGILLLHYCVALALRGGGMAKTGPGVDRFAALHRSLGRASYSHVQCRFNN